MPIQFNAGALRVTILTMTKVGVSERKAAEAAVKSAGSVLRKEIKKNISMNDHTLSQLAAMGHPYARRHGNIAIHRSGGNTIVNPEFRVHTQSGDLIDSLRGAKASGQFPAWKVWIDTGIAPHAHYVVGTLPSYMIPRNFMWSTANSPVVKKRIMQAMTKQLGKVMRTGAVFRATGF